MSPGERPARKGGPAGPATTALCLLLSAGAAAACLLLGAQGAALRARVAALEDERELLRRGARPDALATWAEPHLERLLREVSAGRGRPEEGGAASPLPRGVRCTGGVSRRVWGGDTQGRQS